VRVFRSTQELQVSRQRIEIFARPAAVASTTTTFETPDAASDLHRDPAPRDLKDPPVPRSERSSNGINTDKGFGFRTACRWVR